MNDKEEWLAEQAVSETGFKLKPPAIRLHSADETPKHLTVKALLALKLQQMDRRWDTEVKMESGGRVDVLDLGPADGKAVVYEVQTNATPAEIERKVEQYVGPAVRDVLVIDPTNAPDEPGAILEWLDSHVI
jgi:hypothetical protein